MVIIPCTIKHITLIEAGNGVKYTGPIDYEGMAKEATQGETSFDDDDRYYFCNNCMRKFDGTVTFDECKAHFGTFPLDE